VSAEDKTVGRKSIPAQEVRESRIGNGGLFSGRNVDIYLAMRGSSRRNHGVQMVKKVHYKERQFHIERKPSESSIREWGEKCAGSGNLSKVGKVTRDGISGQTRCMKEPWGWLWT